MVESLEKRFALKNVLQFFTNQFDGSDYRLGKSFTVFRSSCFKQIIISIENGAQMSVKLSLFCFVC